jgi:cytosine/adenosine deaminase-related metal-dependent hydrolase
MEFIAGHQATCGGFGLAPHAPYTVSDGLYRLCAKYSQGRKIPLTTHVAETEQEDDMFRRGLGPLYDYFRRIGRDMRDCKRVGPVNLLMERGVLAPHCLAVHVNCLTVADMQLLKNSGAHVVHCPRSHRYFRRDTALLNGFKKEGINVCLGTDSCASNDKLNMFAEMQELAREFPKMTAEDILAMATVNAAQALNVPGQLGCLAPGAWADMIAVPLDEPVHDPYDAVVFAEKPVCFSMVNGTVVIG